MKSFLTLLLCSILTISIAQNNDLIGLWKYDTAIQNEDSLANQPDFEAYKIYTPTHFFYVHYHGDTFTGCGGGTYEYINGIVIENVHFNSWEKEMTGSRQVFVVKVDGDIHTQDGILHSPRNGPITISEEYTRIEDENEMFSSPISGEWEAYLANWGGELYGEAYSDFICQKIFTKNFFYAVSYFKETGEVRGISFGSYELDGDQYVETLKSFSYDESATNSKVHFVMDFKTPGKLIQRGKINSSRFDDHTIVEYYKPRKGTKTEKKYMSAKDEN